MTNDFQKEMEKAQGEALKVDETKHKKLGLNDVGEKKTEENPLKNYWVGELFNILVFAVVSLVPIGLLTLLDPNWDWSKYATWLFWVDYLTIQAVSWYGRWWMFTTRVRYLVLVDVSYKKNETQIQDFVDKDFEEPFIEQYAEEDNHDRKVRAWRRKVKSKLIRINNRWHINNMATHFKITQNGEINASQPFELKSDKKIREWRKRRLEAKISGLFEKLTTKWIDNNLDTIKVRYSKVSKTILVNGFNPSQTVNDEANYKTESAKVFLSSTMPMFIFVSFIMFLIVPLFGSGLSKDLNAWGMFLTKVALVASSIFMVWLNSRKLFKATEVKAISERNSTLNTYHKKHESKKEQKKEAE
jgi:hypothetical protein